MPIVSESRHLIGPVFFAALTIDASSLFPLYESLTARAISALLLLIGQSPLPLLFPPEIVTPHFPAVRCCWDFSFGITTAPAAADSHEKKCPSFAMPHLLPSFQPSREPHHLPSEVILFNLHTSDHLLQNFPLSVNFIRHHRR